MENKIDKLTPYQMRMSIILGIGYTGTCGLAYFATMFQALFMEATGFDAGQIGTIISAAGIFSLISTFLGGFVADMVSPKRCLQFAYFFNPILAMVVFFRIPQYSTMIIVYCALSLCCQLPKWCPMCKLIAMSGTETQQARLFGWYASFAAIGTLVISVIGSALIGMFDARTGFKAMVAMYSGILLIAGVLLTIFVKEPKGDLGKSNEFRFADIIPIFKTPRLLLSFLAAGCIYITFFAISYINPMLGEVFGVPVATLTLLATLTGGGLNAIVSPIVGTVADKIGSTLKIFAILYVVAMVGCALLTIIPWNSSMLIVAILLLFIIAITQHSSYSIFPSILTEVNAPTNTLGTSTGLMSSFLSAPDMFIYAMAGGMLTAHGSNGYRHILWFAIGFMAVGFIATLALLRMKKAGKFEI